MADKYYAWSPIHTGDKDKNAKVGDEVSATSLGLTKEQFDELIESRAVRTSKYPVPEESHATKSPREHMLDEVAAMQAEGYDAAVEATAEVENK